MFKNFILSILLGISLVYWVCFLSGAILIAGSVLAIMLVVEKTAEVAVKIKGGYRNG